MWSCGLEVGPFTFSVLMNMYSVLARRKMLKIKADFDSGACSFYRRFTDALALGVLKFNLLACRPHREGSKQEPCSDAQTCSCRHGRKIHVVLEKQKPPNRGLFLNTNV